MSYFEWKQQTCYSHLIAFLQIYSARTRTYLTMIEMQHLSIYFAHTALCTTKVLIYRSEWKKTKRNSTLEKSPYFLLLIPLCLKALQHPRGNPKYGKYFSSRHYYTHFNPRHDTPITPQLWWEYIPISSVPVYINLGHLLDTVLLGGHQFHFPRVAGFQNLREKLILAMLRNLSKISEMVPSSSPASQIRSFTIQSLHSPGRCASTLLEMYFG